MKLGHKVKDHGQFKALSLNLVHYVKIADFGCIPSNCRTYICHNKRRTSVEFDRRVKKKNNCGHHFKGIP